MVAKGCGVPAYTVDAPKKVRDVLREAFAQPGLALVEAIVDAKESPMAGKIKMKQALHLAEALARGQKDRWDTSRRSSKIRSLRSSSPNQDRVNKKHHEVPDQAPGRYLLVNHALSRLEKGLLGFGRRWESRAVREGGAMPRL